MAFISLFMSVGGACYRLLFIRLFLLSLAAAAAFSQNTGVITTLAGTTPANGSPVRGFSGDGGPALAAELALANLSAPCYPGILYEQLSHLKLDSAGNLYFADSENQRIRRIGTDGRITTVAGGERANVACGQTPAAGALGDNGPALQARFYNPSDIAIGPGGVFAVADQQANRVREISSTGVVTTISGSGQHNFFAPQIPATSSPMDWPTAVNYSPSGVLHVAEIHSGRIARFVNRQLVVVVGTGLPGFSGDGGDATRAQLNNPSGFAFDAAGNLYIADQLNHRIRRVSAGGTITTIAGNGTPGFGGDGGPATAAQLRLPTDVAVDASGNIYIADLGNHRIRRVAPDGGISTVAGNGVSARGPDGIAATQSSLAFPCSVEVDGQGDLYIMDWQNYLIRKVSFRGGPAIASDGVVNGASFLPPPVPLAPGSIVSIFGSNLATELRTATGASLPAEIDGVSASINGRAMPLYFVSPGQINAQLPFGLDAGAAAVTVTTARGASAAQQARIGPAAAGIFQLAQNRAAALNQDGSLNTGANAAARGSVLVLYLTGQGALDSPIAAGEAAPSDRLIRATLPASARIGGVNAQVLFLGLAPGFIGLAQANILVPDNAPTGDQPVELNIGGQTSNSPLVTIR